MSVTRPAIREEENRATSDFIPGKGTREKTDLQQQKVGGEYTDVTLIWILNNGGGRRGENIETNLEKAGAGRLRRLL